MPMNLTFSLSYRCNSRCKTCNVYKKDSYELTPDEWKKVFKSLGKAPFWVTISGGEPFLRDDLLEIVRALYDNCRPAIINIPTNGILHNRIPDRVKEIASYCKGSQIIINLSLDDIEERHDAIRGVPGNFEKALKSFNGLKKIHLDNLALGIHTVISQFNVSRIPEIYDYLIKLNPDSYITEIAEERVELGTIGCAITPTLEDYSVAVEFLRSRLKKGSFSSVGRLTRSFRLEYYSMVQRIMKEKRQIIPCFSGFASAQVAPDGDVWPCCIKAEPMGNLREHDFDFKKIWLSEKANNLRKSIKNGECFCPLANASYTNMLHDPKTLVKASWNFITLK
ncbi:MAG: radical SAM protein [Desulfatiglans sp.]|nr:radical SAM protein [Desulfatiglans sp.]